MAVYSLFLFPTLVSSLSVARFVPTLQKITSKSPSNIVAWADRTPLQLQVSKNTGDDFGAHTGIPAGDNAAFADSEDEEDDDAIFIATKIPTKESPSWAIGNSFDDFLNQCTVQSFMFLLKTCRDPQTVLWIEQFTQPIISVPPLEISGGLPSGGSGNSKLLSYHGLAAMNTVAFPTWESYFCRLMEQPKELYIIESNQAHIPSYEMDVNPPSLCARMISVREQIAREFTKDLTILSSMGGQTLKAYWQGIRDSRGLGDTVDPLRSGFAGSLLFLDADPDDESDYQPSPLRKGNFDLLVLLATQESIHRALNSVLEDETSGDSMTKANRRFLSNFYLNRLVSHFTGRQRYGRADHFIQELLLSTPGLTISSDDDEGGVSNPSNVDATTMSLTDPTRIAEHILEIRRDVAIEWAQRASNVPESHTEIRRLQLNLLMESYNRNEDDFQ